MLMKPISILEATIKGDYIHMKIMDLLFDGRIYPSEDIVPQSKEYLEFNRNIEAICCELSGKLNDKDYEMVEELCNQMVGAQNLLCREYFKYGLSLGLRLMQESEKTRIGQRSNSRDD